MVLTGISIILGVCVVGLLANKYDKSVKRHRNALSFEDTLDLTGIPIVTFYHGNKELHFLLDSGADKSIINKNSLVNIDHELLEGKNSTVGLGGITEDDNGKCRFNIYYNTFIFEEEFAILDIEYAFAQVYLETGVEIHGILGSTFFKNHGYILDFHDKIIYKK